MRDGAAMYRTMVRAALATAVAASVLTATGGASASPAALPNLSFKGAQAIASPHGATMTFRATLSSASASTVTVHYATKNGTAVAGTDYMAASGTLTLAAGTTSGSVTVTLLPVRLGAGGSNKSFFLDLSSPTGATLSTPSVNGTIHPDVYDTNSRFAFADLVINPASTTAYLTVPPLNEVAVLNLTTGTYGKPIPVGSNPLGIDITPDGKTLLVCDSGGQAISEVNVATRKVTTITTPPGIDNETPFSIAAVSNSNAVYTTTFVGSGFGAHAYALSLATGTSTVVTGIGINGQVTEVSPVSRSADHSTVGVVLGDDSGGPFDVYFPATGNAVSGSLNTFISSSSLDGDGSTMLIDGQYVINGLSGSLLGTINDPGGNSVLLPSGSTGWLLETQAIVRLNITRFLTGTAIKLPQPVNGGAQLALSPNDRILVAETVGGATIVEL
jgi:DNA-binding beta-propeller fold protein YncE